MYGSEGIGLIERNTLPSGAYHTYLLSNPHPVPQQISLANSFLVQRRIPRSEHFCWASENVVNSRGGATWPGQTLLQVPQSSLLQHLTAIGDVEVISSNGLPQYLTEM